MKKIGTISILFITLNQLLIFKYLLEDVESSFNSIQSPECRLPSVFWFSWIEVYWAFYFVLFLKIQGF